MCKSREAPGPGTLREVRRLGWGALAGEAEMGAGPGEVGRGPQWKALYALLRSTASLLKATGFPVQP